MTRKKDLIINYLIWLYSVLFASIPLMGWRNYPNEFVIYEGRCCFPYTTLTCFLDFLLPLLITCGIYIKIYRIASVRNKSVTTARARCECGKLTFTQDTNSYIGNLKAAKTISMFVEVSFLLVNAMKRVYRGARWHSLARSLDFVKYFIYGNYNVPYYNAADQCIRLSPW